MKSAFIVFLMFLDKTFSKGIMDKMPRSNDKVLHCIACIAPIKTEK